jgi:hypothetical protein
MRILPDGGFAACGSKTIAPGPMPPERPGAEFEAPICRRLDRITSPHHILESQNHILYSAIN